MLNNNCNNRCCFDPCECQPEPCCCIGATGATGATGPTGPAGGFQAAYGTFYNNENMELPTSPLPLATFLSVPPVGLNHTPGSPIVTVMNAGIYSVTYGVNNTGSTPFALRINGIILPGSIIIPVGGGYISGGATLALAAGDTLEIVLTEPAQTLINRVFMDVLKVNQ